MKIIFATGNQGKLREIAEIMKDLQVEVISMKEAGLHPDIVEDGKTFAENSIIKVKAVGPMPDAIIMADDSGLSVDAMDGAPGVLSARFMGEDTSYEIKNAAIQKAVSDRPECPRTARYVCVISALLPDGELLTSEGTMEGEIAEEAKGTNGFGYDPVFFLPEYGCTAAELDPAEKNRISHRGIALQKMKQALSVYLKETM